MRNKRGFTLIELLVVIAIIAILAAILFPVFSAAKGKGHQCACMANMKQLGTALYIYLGNWNDVFPANRFQDPLMPVGQKMNGTRYNWKTALHTTLTTRTDVWRCRTNRNSDSFDETGTAVIGAVGEVPRFPISYADNGDFFNAFGADYSLRPIKLGDLRRPTKLLLIVESVMVEPDIHADFGEQDWAWYQDLSSGTNVSGCRIVIHHGKVTNCLFTDTHAKAMKLYKTFVPRTMWYQGNHSKYNQEYYDGVASRLANEAL